MGRVFLCVFFFVAFFFFFFFFPFAKFFQKSTLLNELCPKHLRCFAFGFKKIPLLESLYRVRTFFVH